MEKRPDTQNNTDKVEHLNLALRAIRNINRLLVREKDRDRLLKGICQILIQNRGYDKVWIALTDENGAFVTWEESGLGGDFDVAIEALGRGEVIECVQNAMERSGAVIFRTPADSCIGCPLSSRHAGWGVITVRLIHEEVTYGLLSVSIPNELISDDVEQALVEEIAGDIAYGLYRIRREMEHQRADAALRKRVRELSCLFGLSGLIEKPNISLEEILQGAVDLLPAAMQYPEAACAQILFEENVFQTDGYVETNPKISRELIVSGFWAGSLTVCYRPSVEPGEERAFLEEEKALLRSIATRIGKVIERKQGRKALEESEKRFRDLVEHSHTCIAIVQGDRVVYRNPGYRMLFGSSISSGIFPDLDRLHPDDLENVRGAVGRFLASREPKTDLEFRFYPVQRRIGRRGIKWAHCRISRIEHQRREALLVNLMDITLTKDLEHLLKMQDKMTSLGRVAAGIAHEIRNPLSGINIYLKALEKLYRPVGDEEAARAKVAKIFSQLQSASNKIESVIRRVMDFSRPGEPKFEVTDINQPVKEAINLLSVTLRKSGTWIDIDLSPDLPQCRVDPHMIEQVILNLVTNASEAMKYTENEKRIRISTFSWADSVHITVTDSGPGVPEDIMDSIFDPFYTTKSNSSGIGLSICNRIVTDHGGSLEVSAGGNGGAQFTIKIPIFFPEGEK